MAGSNMSALAVSQAQMAIPQDFDFNVEDVDFDNVGEIKLTCEQLADLEAVLSWKAGDHMKNSSHPQEVSAPSPFATPKHLPTHYEAQGPSQEQRWAHAQVPSKAGLSDDFIMQPQAPSSMTIHDTIDHVSSPFEYGNIENDFAGSFLDQSYQNDSLGPSSAMPEPQVTGGQSPQGISRVSEALHNWRNANAAGYDDPFGLTAVSQTPIRAVANSPEPEYVQGLNEFQDAEHTQTTPEDQEPPKIQKRIHTKADDVLRTLYRIPDPARRDDALEEYTARIIARNSNEIFYSNLNEAIQDNTRPTWKPRSPDPTLPTTDLDRQQRVLQLLVAINSTEHAIDQRSKPFQNRWEPEDGSSPMYYSAEEKELLAWDILNLAEDFHVHGSSVFVSFDHEFWLMAKASSEWSFGHRMRAIIELLEYSKARCERLLYGRGLQDIVANPERVLKKIKNNKKQNGLRSVVLAANKKAKEERADEERASGPKAPKRKRSNRTSPY